MNYLSHVYLTNDRSVNLHTFKEDLEKIAPTDPNFLQMVVHLNLLDGIRGRRLKELKDFLEEKKVWDILVEFGDKIPVSTLQTIRFLAGSIFFIREEFVEANRWFRANVDSKSGSAEALIGSEVYLLLCKFEMGLTAGITQKKLLLESLRQRLDSSLQSFDTILLDALHHVLKSDKIGNLKAVSEKYLPMLQEKIDAKNEASHFSLFVGWLESKAKGLPLRVAVDPYL